ncbi:acylphosphatase [Methanoplanus endosymbiosus]|uniref:acylphosphatase n=1 Tax=Methanoplanus endosymbiosus TaxID=33865 RepID=A0A9E7PLA8_9EURY|nr:acylphosphatase [Methanoplanus endosymbiosus]UUX92273.1 acylphosphatase [Methanoplanus endosymbiosus]
MKRIQIIVSCNVQNAEFREYILKEAFDRDITGYVKNLGDARVEIIAEGKEEELRTFFSQTKITCNSSAVDSEYVNTKIEKVLYRFRFETLSSYVVTNDITFINESSDCISVINMILVNISHF